MFMLNSATQLMKRIIPLFLIFILSCVDPYDVEIDKASRLLSVEGFITTEPGPYQIRLTRSDKYGSVFDGVVVPVLRATVSIRDEFGRTVFLTEGNRGRYETPAGFRAEVGLSYTLQIETSDGLLYTSLPERVAPVPEIDSLTFRTYRIPTQNPLLDVSGLQVFAHFNDPSDQVNYYYWRNKSATYILIANPELVTDEDRNPTPKDCCARCFLTEQPNAGSIVVASDTDFNGLNTRLPISFIADDGKRFREMFRLDIQQLSLTPRAYNYLRLAKQQVEISGSVFDPPPANLRSNIINVNDPSETVLGYFFAADARTKRIYVQRNQLQLTLPPALIPDDCRLTPGTTTIQPADWFPFGN